MAQWDKLTTRGDVEDRRSMRPAAILGGGISLTGIALLLVVNYLSGGSVGDVLNQLVQQAPIVQEQPADTAQFAGQDEYEVFASTVLGSNNDMWEMLFAKVGSKYDEPTLVLFRQETESACGGASADVGPHYCPLDQTIYLDETFFDELTQRLGAQGGDVAEAYVIAHEVGHHVQNQLGTIDARPKGKNENETSILIELQADCFAGLWAGSIKDQGVFLPGEINEAMDAAAAVGDDRIQRTATGHINPESWTHGSSEQRVTWFNRGFETGEFEQCDTFK